MCEAEEDTTKNKREIIKKLFDFFADEIYESTETNRKLAKKIIKQEEDFINTLTEEQKKKFEELDDLRLKNIEETDSKIFVYSFSLGIKLIIDGLLQY